MAVERATRQAHIVVNEATRDDRIGLRIAWPERAIYPGERIPVTVEWSFDAELESRIANYEICEPRSSIASISSASSTSGPARARTG